MDGAISGSVSGAVAEIGGGKKGEDARNKTTLTADKFFSFWAPTIPLLFLAFVMYFNGGIFKSATIACEQHTEQDEEEYTKFYTKNANRFYFGQYCFEKMIDWDWNSTVVNGTEVGYQAADDLSIHKFFPYLALVLIALTTLPSAMWSSVNKHLQVEVEFLLGSLIECLNITVEEIMKNLKIKNEQAQEKSDQNGGSLLSDEKVEVSVFERVFSFYRDQPFEVQVPRNLSEGSELMDTAASREQLQAQNEKGSLELFNELSRVIKDNRSEEIDAKFSVFKTFLMNNVQTREYFTKFLLFRVSNMLVLGFVTTVLYYLSWSQSKSHFTCMVDFNGVQETTACAVGGTDIRLIVTGAWMAVNTFLIVAVFIATITDLRSIRDSQYLLQMIDQVINTEGIRDDYSDYNDLSLLLKLISLNLADKNIVLNMALKSWSVAADLYKFDVSHTAYYMDHLPLSLGHKKRSKFLSILTSSVAMAMKEDIDEQVDAIAGAAQAD